MKTPTVPAESLDVAMGSFLRTVADLERARRIAVELEQDAAAWKRVALAWDAVATVPYCQQRHSGEHATMIACSLPVRHSGACVFIGRAA